MTGPLHMHEGTPLPAWPLCLNAPDAPEEVEGSITHDRSEVTCRECLEWMHA